MAPIPSEDVHYTTEDMGTAIRSFKAKKIAVYEPGEDNYERYVATNNLIYRFSSPPCVVQPKCACEVRDIIKIAKPLKIPIRIKNGGHSYAGGSTTNIGILMELGLMNEVILDKKSEPKTVTIKGGALWFSVYKKLVSQHLDGYTVNGGRCPTVGASGFILGGGLSPFTRSFGMGCDTVEEFTIVTAAGDEVTVSKDDKPDTEKGKLFWALSGAGGGNFGVVVEMKLALQKLRSEMVVAGRYTWYPKAESLADLKPIMNSFYTQKWPNEMTIDSSWLCELDKKEPKIGVRYLVYYNGGRADFNRDIDSWTMADAPAGHAELKKQLKQRSLEEKSSRFLHETLAAQWIEETRKSFPTNRTYQIYTSFVFENRRETIEKVTEIIHSQMTAFGKQFASETGLMQVTFIHSGGAAQDKKREATAFRWRDCTYHSYIMLEWNEKWLEQDMRAFLEATKTKMGPYGMVPGATFINFPDDTLQRHVVEKAYYGSNYAELRRVKKIWDANNFFEWPQGVQLPQVGDAQPVAGDDEREQDVSLMADISRAELVVKETALTDATAAMQWQSYRPISSQVFGNEALPALVS